MSAPQGCTDDMAVVESFKEALKGRVGADRYRMWFTHGVGFALVSEHADHVSEHADHQDSCADAESDDVAVSSDHARNETRPALMVSVRGQFALDRLRKNFLSEIRGAAMQACGARMDVQLCLDEPEAHQAQLPLDASDTDSQDEADSSSERASSKPSGLDTGARQGGGRRNTAGRTSASSYRGSTKTLSQLVGKSSGSTGRKHQPKGSQSSNRSADASALTQLPLPVFESASPDEQGNGDLRQAQIAQPAPQMDRDEQKEAGGTDGKMTSANFIPGHCNRLAHTAMVMACQEPATATPLFLCGPTGTGKTHLLSAIAEQLRRRHRMRRVIHLSAEQFTNDFISSVGNSGITAFRRRYREVDALLIDDVQFLGSKKATLREMLYTVETLAGSGRPLVFSGSHSPTEIDGLSRELAGRMAAGLVCSVQPLDSATRETLLRKWIAERCQLEVPDCLIDSITPLLAGDGRVISGMVNVIHTLQRMYQRTPTLDELRQFGGQLLRGARPMTTLSVIETAVCEAFQLPPDSLRGKSQTRAVTGPRMLAMYLSRQLTPAAYAEIARHFGGRSHSTAISAEQHVKTWLAEGGQVGRGRSTMSAREAIDRVETLLRSG